MARRKSTPQSSTNNTNNSGDAHMNGFNGVVESAQKIRTIGDAARGIFFEREEPIHAMECALASGEHLLMLGPPGTAKSAIARFFANAMAVPFFWSLLNPDTTKESIFGPISAKQLAENDLWVRKWAGFAVSRIAFMDEVGKASNQVINLLLTAMEERKAREADSEIDLPIHTVVSASNESLDGDAAAMWDRFTVRLVVREIKSMNNFAKMLTTNTANVPHVPIEPSELELLRSTTKAMALNVSKDVINTLVEMRQERITISKTYISDRRWSRILHISAGQALLNERTHIEVEDLIVAKWLLWDDTDEIEAIHKWVEDKVFADLQALRDYQALLEELELSAQNLASLGEPEQLDLLWKCKKLARNVSNQDHSKHTKEWEALSESIAAIERTLIDD